MHMLQLLHLPHFLHCENQPAIVQEENLMEEKVDECDRAVLLIHQHLVHKTLTSLNKHL